MTRLTMVRHGETDANRKRLLQGQRDTPLNENGLKQAQTVANVLRSEQFDMIWSSPLQRAYHTAQCILEYHRCPLVVQPGLIERAFGQMEGAPVQDLFALEEDWDGSLYDLPLAEGETLRALYERAGQLKDQILAEPSESLLLVGHAGLFRPLIGHLLGYAFEQWFSLPQHNCCIHQFRIEDGQVLAWQLNDHSHCE